MKKVNQLILIVSTMLMFFFALLAFPEIVQADTTTTAEFSNNLVQGNFYQTTIKFQLSNEGTQLILYSPNYDDLAVSALKNELGTSNVIEDSSQKQLIVNLKDKIDKNRSGSFTIEMKKSASDVLYVRDINSNELVNEDLATGKAVPEIKSQAAALSATDLLPESETTSVNNALPVNNALDQSSTSNVSPTSANATLTVPVITVEAASIDDFNNDFTVHGTWESPSTSITIYYRFIKNTSGMTSGEDLIPGIEKWGVFGTFTGTAGVVHNFTATIPKNTLRGLQAGGVDLFTNYVDPVQGNMGTSYSTRMTIVPYADNLTILMDGEPIITSYDQPYIARGSSITLGTRMSTNNPGTLRFVVDGDTSNAPSVNITIAGSSTTATQKINLNNLGSDDGRIHEASYEYVVSGKVMTSANFYFVVGSQLKLTVPTNIDFGSHLYTDLINGYTSTPTVTGQLSLFDGRVGTYSGNLGISTTATTFKNSDGDELNANLYWGNTLVPTDGSSIQVAQMAPPTSTAPAFKNFTQNVKDDLKLEIPSNSSPKSGSYTSTMTWTVNDTLK